MKAYHKFTFGQGRLGLQDKVLAAQSLVNRGIAGNPPAPRNVQIQSGARKVLLTWNLAQNDQITTGWRVYRDTESNLIAEIRDRGTRQLFVDVTAGSTPPVYNFFVSGISSLGNEGPKVQIQGSAKTEAGAPADPSVPPDFTSAAAGGGNTDFSPINTNGGRPVGGRIVGK